MSSKLWLSKFKKLTSRSVFGKLQVTQISLNFKTSGCNLKSKAHGAKLYVTFLLFWFWKEFCLLNKNINLIKKKQNRKWKILCTVLERPTLCFSWYKIRKLKVKLWWVGPRERKKKHFLHRLFYSKEVFLTFASYPNV